MSRRIRFLIEKIKDSEVPTPDQTELFKLVLELLPQPSKRGKKCPECNFRMENRCSTCPNCQHVMLKRRRVQYAPVSVELESNECNICGKSVDTDECVLQCGCKYHQKCVVYLASYSDRCCEHKDVVIPDKYKT